jgi:hypothetical protein
VVGLLNEIQTQTELTPHEQVKAAIEAVSSAYKTYLYLLCRFGLGYLEINDTTHGGMINTLQRKTNRKLIVMPRGTFKTSIAVVGYCISRIINDFNIRIMIDSELYSNSKNSLREIKTHLVQPHMVNLFGQFENEACWNETEIIIKQRTRIVKEPTIVCSGLEVQKTGQHYDVIICDDLNSEKNVNNPENRKKVIDHYRYYTSILEPGGTIVVIGTRYSTEDLIGHILDHEVKEQPGLIYE